MLVADVNVEDYEGKTALIEASLKGYSEIVELLINIGGDGKGSSRSRATPLMEASFRGHTEIG